MKLFEQVWSRDRRTTLFASHEIGEALRLADILFVLSSVPARVAAHYPIDIPHGKPTPGSGRLAEIERELYGLLAPAELIR